MASKTANYNLTKPDENDYYDINIPNGNMDIIDAQLKKAETNQNEAATHLQNEIDAIGKAKGQPNGYAELDDKGSLKQMPTAAQVGAIPASASCNKNWNWAGQGGQPTWLWGGNDGTNMFVWNPGTFHVWAADNATCSTHWVGSGGWAVRNIVMSAGDPSGGADGDVWHKYS